MLDIAVPEIMLQGAGVVAIVGELEAAGMAKHVRMHGKGHLGGLAEPCHEVMEADWAHRPAALANEDMSLARVFAPQSAQSADLIATDRMHAWHSMLGSAHVQAALVEFDLMPFEAADFRSPQPVPISDQDHGCIAMAVPTDLAGGVHESLDFALGEVAALDCEAFDAWCDVIGCLICHDKKPLC